MATINRYLLLLAAIVLGLGLLSAGSSALGFEFNGTVLLPNGTGANGTNITVTVVGNLTNTSLNTYTAWSWSTLANASGYFNFSLPINETNNSIYKVTMKKHVSPWLNISCNYTGPILPAGPKELIVNELSNSTFYLIPAVNINITAYNLTGTSIAYINGIIIDEKLGVVIDNFIDTFNKSTWQGNPNTYVSNTTQYWAVLPADRNYTVFVWQAYQTNTTDIGGIYRWNKSSALVPRIVRITNTSNYPLGAGQARQIDINLNLSIDSNNTMSTNYQTPGLQTVNGTIKLWPGLTSDAPLNFTKVIAYPFLREAGNLTVLDLPIDNRTGMDQNVNTSNIMNGMFNITLLGMQDYILVGFANDSTVSSKYYAGFTNITLNKSNLANVTIYVRPLAGSYYENNMTYNTMNTSLTVFKFINGDTNLSINDTIRVKVKTVYNGTEMNWITLTNLTGHFCMPLWNSTVTVTAYNPRYAPTEYTVYSSEVNASQMITISLYKYRTLDPDTGVVFYPSLMQYVTTSKGCDKPAPDVGCNLTSWSGETELATIYKQPKGLMGNASLRVKNTAGIIVHYKSVDLIASGVPDVDIDTAAASAGAVGDQYLTTWKIGSKAPSNSYGPVLVGIPYEGSLYEDGGAFNVTLTYLYDNRWNIIWDTAVQGTTAPTNLAAYSTFNTSWFSGMTCEKDIDIRINTTQSCYVNTTDNYVWLHIPHFSGMMVQVKAPKATTATTPATTGGSSAGGGAGAAGSSTSTYWSSVDANTATSMEIFGLPNVPAASIKFTLSESATAVKMTVSTLSDKPTIITTDPVGTVYKYFGVTASNIDATNIASAKILFRVDKAWITENSVDVSTIKLARFTDKWDILETKQAGEDAAYNHFEATTPGFSTFVVIAQTTGGQTVTTPATTTTTTTTPGQIQIPVQLQKPANLGILAAIIAVIALVGYILMKKPSRGGKGRRKSAEE